jgi:hypothetical protein
LTALGIDLANDIIASDFLLLAPGVEFEGLKSSVLDLSIDGGGLGCDCQVKGLLVDQKREDVGQ